MQLYALGMPMTVVVDDYLPAFQQEDGSFTTLFSELSADSPLWTVIIEKAFAKRYGNYEHITSGVPSEAIRALTGNPILKYAHDDMNEETLWQLITDKNPVDDFIIASTEDMKPEDVPKNFEGVKPGHSYSIIGTHTLSKSKTRMVKIRNPWGKPGFHGTWKGDQFDAQARSELGYDTDGKEGIFWIDLETYKKSFSETSISFNGANWATAKYLKTNDKS